MSEKINPDSFKESHLPFPTMQELVSSLATNPTVWSWGAKTWTKMNDHLLRFAVNGHHHSGHVYLAVNCADLFDVYLTTSQGTIKEAIHDVFVGDLIAAVDARVERLPEYRF